MAKKGTRNRWIVGGAIIVAAVVAMSFISLNENLVYFYTPAEAHAKAASLEDQIIKVGGMVVPGTVQWRAEDLHLQFTMSDMQGHDIVVAHKGTPPDMFKEGQGVVVEGRIADAGKTFQSRKLMVKHSEEYKQPGDHSTMDKALLEQSLFKE